MEETKRPPSDGLQEKILAESQPSFFSHLMVHWPCAICFVSLLVGMACMVTTAVSIELVEDSERTFLVWSDTRIKKFDAYNLALDEYENVNNKGKMLPLQSEEVADWLVWIVYEAKGSSLLTPDGINEIHHLEEGLTQIKNYGNVCYRRLRPDGERECDVAATSAARFFAKDSSQSEIDTALDHLLNDTTLWANYGSLYDESLRKDKTAKWLRTSVKFGAPIEDSEGQRYAYYLEDEDQQDDFMEEFAMDAAEYVEEFESEEFNVYFYNKLWFEKEFDKIILDDFAYIIISILFVLFYMMMHTRSIVIPLVGMGNIIMAFPMAYVLYRFIFQVSFFNMMSLLSVFIILGISADNMFVFMDTWKQSKEHEVLVDNLERKMIWTYRKAAHAMLVTTLTTFCAFMATGISPIMPISAFGIFAACFILFNYLLVITAFPAVVVMREKVLMRRKKGNKGEEMTPVFVVGADLESSRAVPDIDESTMQVNYDRSHSVNRAMEMSKQDRFFYTTFSSNIKWARWPIIGLFTAWMILSIILTTQITPPSEQENWVNEDHYLREATEAMDENFTKGEDDGAQILHIVWGIDGVDQDAVDDRWDPKDEGVIEWDNEFDMSHPDAQQALYDFCQRLKIIDDEDLVQDASLVTCFIDSFSDYANANVIGGFPVPQDDFMIVLEKYMEDDHDAQEEIADKRIGLIGDRLRYVSFKTIGGELEAASEMFPRYDDWEDILDEFKRNAPPGVDRPFQTSTGWLWMVTERALVMSAFSGIGIASLITFVVLVFSTTNVLLSLYAILCILGIILSVMSIMFFQGWDFGTAESVAVVILIGFSVDYVVHLSHAYIESHSTDRYNRTRDALAKMGFSILGGAVTTFGDGCVLFFCTIIFFSKFAWVITSTILFALLWALLFLSALMMTIGPQGDTGNVRVYWVQLKAWFAERKEQQRLTKIGAGK